MMHLLLQLKESPQYNLIKTPEGICHYLHPHPQSCTVNSVYVITFTHSIQGRLLCASAFLPIGGALSLHTYSTCLI